MIKEIIYAQKTCGHFVKITIFISDAYWSKDNHAWACSLELSSDDGKLNFSNPLYNVTAISVSMTSLQFIATLIENEQKKHSWKLCYSTEENDYINSEYPLYEAFIKHRLDN